jgi:hypothetical protein
MKISVISFFLLLFISVEISIAQEIQYPLNDNQTIKGYLLKNSSSSFRISSGPDTLSLPFIDDFAQEGIYPDIDLWTDSQAFVNSTICDNPPTVGVATFDGINEFGNRYSTSIYFQHCDSLTSKPIYLGAYASDTTVWLSFYYQPKGIGLAPTNFDSLLLYFKDTADVWTRVWFRTGVTSGAAFQRVNIHVNDARYLYDGFQFRFMNFGPPNKNSDHWHIDYVYLNNFRIENDSILDVGFINKPTSILAEYQSMPWRHYSTSIAYKTNMSDSVRNLNYGPTTIIYFTAIYDEAGNLLFDDTLNDGASNSGLVSLFDSPLEPPIFQPTPVDSAIFLIKDSLAPNGAFNFNNDIVTYQQKFYNYYAYDDGSAESNAGLSGNNLKWAMKYDVKMQDTLRGLQIYFNPTSLDVSNQLIQIAVWSNIAVPNTEVLLHKTINQYPANIDSINGFATYLFDTAQVVGPGNIWVGLIQNNNVLIGLGVDRNNDSHTKMFYATSGTWAQSTIASTWMIRPWFGRDVVTVGINESSSVANTFEVYPVPANDKIRFSVHNASLNYELTDIAGRVVLTGQLTSEEVNMSGLTAGIYFVRLTDKKNQSFSGTKKILINR